MPDDDPAALLLAARAGDRQAVEDLARWAHKVALAHLRSMIGRQDLRGVSAEDLAQEAVIGLLRWQGEAGNELVGLVRTIAYRRLAEVLRSPGYQHDGSLREVPDGPDHEAAGALAAVEAAAVLRPLLVKLSPRYRSVLMLRIGLDMNPEETGRLLGMTPGSVRVTQVRALAHARAGTTPLWFTPGAPGERCGTSAGYHRHRRAGEPTCSACRAAHNQRGKRNQLKRAA